MKKNISHVSFISSFLKCFFEMFSYLAWDLRYIVHESWLPGSCSSHLKKIEWCCRLVVVVWQPQKFRLITSKVNMESDGHQCYQIFLYSFGQFWIVSDGFQNTECWFVKYSMQIMKWFDFGVFRKFNLCIDITAVAWLQQSKKAGKFIDMKMTKIAIFHLPLMCKVELRHMDEPILFLDCQSQATQVNSMDRLNFRKTPKSNHSSLHRR